MPGKASESFRTRHGGLRLPEAVGEPGLLVGWSLESVHPRVPVGFSFDGSTTPRDSTLADPVLLGREGHVITIAPTGAGKGVGCIVPALLRHEGPVIVIDPKGENVAVTARARRERGQKVVVLDPSQISGFEGGQLNPLDMIDALTASGVDDAAVVARLLLPASHSARNQYWENRARQLLIGVLLHVMTDLPEDERTLATVREIVNLAAANAEALIDTLRGSYHPEARAAASLFEIAAPETLGGIISFAQEGIDFIRGPLVQAATRASSFSLDEVTRGDPLSVYIVIPPHLLAAQGRLLRLWVGAMMNAIMRRRARTETSTLFLLDEAAQLGPLDELRQAVTLLRGYGLQTWSFWQDVSQLRQLYPADWQTMVNNSKVVQCFGANTMVAAADMAAIVGWPDPAGLMGIGRDEMLLQIAGDEAVIAKLPNYRSDPVFAGAFDENPFYDPARDPVGPPRTPLLEYIRPPAPPRSLRQRAGGEPVYPRPGDVNVSRALIRWHREQGRKPAGAEAH